MPDTLFLLKAREVAKAVRKAMAEERLGYQCGHEECQYRYSDGAVCAIGAALPDNIYTEEMEGHSVQGLKIRKLVDIRPQDIDLLTELQSAHDMLCEEPPNPNSEARFARALADCEAA